MSPDVLLEQDRHLVEGVIDWHLAMKLFAASGMYFAKVHQVKINGVALYSGKLNESF